MNFNIFFESKETKPALDFNSIILKTRENIKEKLPVNLNLIFTNNQKIKSLNKVYRNKDKVIRE